MTDAEIEGRAKELYRLWSESPSLNWETDFVFYVGGALREASAEVASLRERAERAEAGWGAASADLAIETARANRMEEALRAQNDLALERLARAVAAEQDAERLRKALAGLPCMFVWASRRAGSIRMACSDSGPYETEPIPEHAWCPSCRARALAGERTP